VIEYLDRPATVRSETRVYELRHAQASTVAQQLNDLIADSQQPATGRARTPATPAPPTPRGQTPPGVIRAPAAATPTVTMDGGDRSMIVGRVKVLADERTNTLVILSEPANYPFFDEVVAVLDREVDPEMGVEVYPLEYADAEEASSILNDFIGTGTRRTTGTGAAGGATDPRRPTGTPGGATDARSQSLRDFIEPHRSSPPRRAPWRPAARSGRFRPTPASSPTSAATACC
jgi:general secretion pathway protein D